MLFLRLSVMGFVLFSLWAGVGQAKKAYDTFEKSSRAFEKVDGRVEEVRRHVVGQGGHGAAPAINRVLAEIRFSYPHGNGRAVANTASALCVYCEHQEIVRLTGKRPSSLAYGEKIAVYVDPSDTTVAYLEKPSTAGLPSQLAIALLWLIAAPSFALVVYRNWSATPA
jgi:hypothetical protein